jgi:hypothetical protein
MKTKNMLLNNIFVVVVLLFSVNSCIAVKPVKILSVESIKKQIEEEHPELRVNIREEWWTQNIGLDFFFHDGRRLYLWYVRKNLAAPFRIGRIGEYKLTGYYQYPDGSQNWSLRTIPIGVIGQELGVSFNTVNDAIKYYDMIYSYVRSLRDINEEEIQAEREKHGPYWIWYTDKPFNKIVYRYSENQDVAPPFFKFTKLYDFEYYIFKEFSPE